MWRERLIFGSFFLCFLLITVRLFYWQVYSHERLFAMAQDQQLMRLEIPAARGEIVSSDRSPLVTNQIAFLVYAEPKKIKDKTLFAQKISEILQVDSASISAQLASSLYWTAIKHKVTQETVDRLRGLEIEGIGFERENMRSYPEGSMSAHLLGFVGSAYDGSPKGYFGLEGYFDRDLRGRYGVLQQAKDARGEPVLVGMGDRLLAENGNTLRLFLDRSVQYIAEQKLLKAIEQYGAKGGTVTIMNPQTGGITAMASYPSYDPRAFSDYPNEQYKNPVISAAYEPGSTFKVLIVAAAIEHGLIDASTRFAENGPIEIGGYQIRTWNDKYHGMITTREILEKSSNVGMVAIAKKLGRQNLISAITNFGFGQPTGVDLEEETSPELRPEKAWKEIDLATASFGQGIAVTPLQMIRAVAAIANGGYILVPHVVSEIIGINDKKNIVNPQTVRRVISPETARLVADLMSSAVDNGEARYRKPKGYKIAGKTGTAQIPVAGHYDREKTIASFVGFAPSDDPQFIMLVTLLEPSSSPWGSETAAPLFFDIARELFAYYGIHPSQ